MSGIGIAAVRRHEVSGVIGLTGAAVVAGLLSIASPAHGQELSMLEPAAGELPAPVPVLAPGEFTWHPEDASVGDVLISIGLDDQIVHVYRGGALAGVSSMSSGRAGYETPRGVYTILQKRKRHHSNLYDDAPMPYMQRLTWDGLALHAGRLPGYPASHGCTRLPKRFATLLYGMTSLGTTVVVANEVVTPERADELGLYAEPPVDGTEGYADTSPITGKTTADLNRAMLTGGEPTAR